MQFVFKILFLTIMIAGKCIYAQTLVDKKQMDLVRQFEKELLFSRNKASKTAEVLISEFENKNTHKAKALVQYIKALLFLKAKNKPNIAKIHAKKAYQIHAELKDSLALFKDINTLYKCHVYKREYDSAVYYATKEIELADKLKKPSYQFRANLDMGDVYYWISQHEKVITHRKKALTIAQKHDLKKELSEVHIKMAQAHFILSRQRTQQVIDSAIYHGKKSLMYAKQANYTYGIYRNTVILADFLNVNKQHKEALSLIETVITLPKDKRPINFDDTSIFYYAAILKDNGRYNEAKENIQQLIRNLKPKQYNRKMSTYFFLSVMYSYIKKPDSADYAIKQAVIANNAASEIKINEKVAKLQTQYETEKKVQEIKQLKQQQRLEQLEIKDLQRQRLILGISLLIPLIFLIGGGWYVNRRRLKLQLENEQKERAKQLSELKALRAQMNPHFMFNALSSIQDFILLNETNQASEYLGSFAQLTRGYLDASKKETITLATEIKLLKLYIELEGLRLGNDFSANFKIDTDIDTEKVNIPPLFIQPYIENSFKHGLIHKKGKKNFWITFSKEPVNDKSALKIMIRDNGIGRKKSAEINARKNKTHQSFAIQANQQRLELLNNTKNLYKNIQVLTEDLYNNEGKPNGTQVTLILV